jgi:phospholipid/cholesterol/gamma-HCH transport system substrate-binding protein
MREISIRRALGLAGFTLAVVLVSVFALLSVANRHWQWQKTFEARAAFRTIAGVEAGAKVLVQGLDAGAVEAIEPPRKPGDSVVLVLRLDDRLRGLVRSDAVVRITTQGVVGSKLVEVVPGRPDASPLAPGGMLRAETPIELADLLQKASESLAKVDAVAGAAEQGLGEINAIAATIRRGDGTLGRLVQEDEAYMRLMALSTKGERAIEDLEENLTALKGIWPISGYFNRRGFTDVDRVLYQPGSLRVSRVYGSDELFEPGKAVLTESGRRRLDETGRWFRKNAKGPETEVVVASRIATAPRDDEQVAQMLTQGQAEAVRAYLVEQQGIDKLPWYRFSRRKVAAVGLGTQVPRAMSDDDGGPAAEARDMPPSRTEIILFTPQTVATSTPRAGG